LYPVLQKHKSQNSVSRHYETDELVRRQIELDHHLVVVV